MRSQEEQDFLTINGIQTQSATTTCLLDVVPEMAAMGVDILRLSPQSRHMAEIVEVFYEVLAGELPLEEGMESLHHLAVGEPSNGFWHGRSGMEWHARVVE